MLPHVVRFNADDDGARMIYAQLASEAGIRETNGSPMNAVDGLIARLQDLLGFAGLPVTLTQCGVERNSIRKLAEEATVQWTAGFNPRSATRDDFVRLYEAAFG
jgi:alcohol dehydrogenase class IV